MRTLPPALILAGGLGTRLKGISGDTPKVLVPFRGRTFLDWKIANLASQGVSDIFVLVSYGSQQVSEHIRFMNYPVSVTCLDEGSKPLGTAKALLHAMDSITAERFILTYGDNILQLPLVNFVSLAFPQENSLMCVTKEKAPGATYNCKLQGQRVVAHSKRVGQNVFDCLDYGYSIIARDHFLMHCSDQNVDLSEVFSKMAHTNTLLAYESKFPLWEIGNPQSYYSASEDARLGNYLRQLEQAFNLEVGR